MPRTTRSIFFIIYSIGHSSSFSYISETRNLVRKDSAKIQKAKLTESIMASSIVCTLKSSSMGL